MIKPPCLIPCPLNNHCPTLLNFNHSSSPSIYKGCTTSLNSDHLSHPPDIEGSYHLEEHYTIN